MNIVLLSKFLNLKYSLFSIIFLAATTCLALSFPSSLKLSFQLLWTLLIGGVAFLCARITGIVVNQIIDANIDKRNPRTANRVLPSKQLSLTSAFIILALSALSFVVLCLFLNTICTYLALFSVGLMIVYSYSKRITYLCHWLLGTIYFFAILMNFYVLNPITSSNHSIIISLWGIAVGLIVAGNDIIYSIQDLHFDQTESLFSIPARFGKKRAVQIASLCIAASLCLYLAIPLFLSLPYPTLVVYLFPVFVGGRVIKSYLSVKNQELEQCFFNGNIALALSFLLVMVTLFIFQN